MIVAKQHHPRSWDGNESFAAWIADNCDCTICRVSPRQMHAPRVASAPDLRLDESLIGVVARVMRAEHHRSLFTLLRHSIPTEHAYLNLAARDDVNFETLAHTLRIAPHEIEDRRYRMVQIRPDLPGYMFHGATVPTYDLRFKFARTARSWLKEDGYHSALGHHGLVPHCPVSGELLIEECPKCSSKLRWTTPNPMQCRHCDFNLATMEVDTLPDHVRASTNLMVDIIHPHPARQYRAIRRLPEALVKIDRGLIFELGWRLGTVFTMSSLTERDVAWQLPASQKVRILAQGSSFLSDWPFALREAVAARVKTQSGEADLTFTKEFRKLMCARRSLPVIRSTILHALPEAGHWASRMFKQLHNNSCNAAETARILGVSQQAFARIRATNALKVVVDGGTVNKHQIIDLSGSGETIKNFSDRMSEGAACEKLSMPRHGIEQLCCHGLIVPFTETLIRVAFIDRQLSLSSIQTFCNRLQARSIAISVSERVPLHQAVKCIGGVEKPWGPLFSAFMVGKLPFELDEEDDRPLVKRLHVRDADLSKIGEMRFDENQFPDFEFQKTMSGRDVETLLNITPKAMSAALKCGLLRRGSPRDGFEREKMLETAREYISGGEILMRWGNGSRKMPAIFNRWGGLARRNSLGWKRGEVETYMAENFETKLN